MTDPLGKLAGVHPQLVADVQTLTVQLAAQGFRLHVTDGVRTTAQQQALYAQGRTVGGPVVTNADGVVKRSNHQPHADGWGHAVDCCFLDAVGQPSWDATRYPFAQYGALAKA